MAERGSPLLGGISAERFLREYWQQKPLLVRAAIPGFGSELSGEELAGLALEPEIESRLVIERGTCPWELRRGPFKARDFRRLPESRWTLLVQAVDQWLPAAQALRARFDFLPGWRFDDVMVSYAADKGGVGPHVDQYDVFLVQGSGQRRWRIGQRCDASTPLRRDTELRILKRFETEAEYLLDPGDMLYLPPGLAHWGIAEGPCMTWSVGFRAPSAAEIVQDVAAEAAERLPEDRRFADAGMAWPRDGEIPAAAIAQLRGLLQEALDDDALLAQWFACYMTGRKYPDLDITPPRRPSGGINALLARGLGVERHPASRFAWLRGRPARLFVDGESMSCPTALARVLCSQAPLTAAQLGAFAAKPETRAVLDRLLASGALRRAE